MTNSAISPTSVASITSAKPEPGVFVDMSFLLEKMKPTAQTANDDNEDFVDSGSDHSGSSEDTESSSEVSEDGDESSVSSIYSSETSDDSDDDDSSFEHLDLEGIEVLALARAPKPSRTPSNCSVRPVGADTAARKPRRTEEPTEDQVFDRLLAGNHGAASSLQNMIKQAEKAATMNLLKEQQERQGATHDLVDKKPKAPTRGGGDFAPQPIKRTSSIANFQAMGHIKQVLPRELGGDVRQSLKRTNSITNFQAMGHNKEKARSFFDQPAANPSAGGGDSFNSSDSSAATALAQLLATEQVHEIAKGGPKRTTSKTFAGAVKPDDHLRSLLGNPGYFAFDNMPNFFLRTTQEQIDLWDGDLVTAIREHDLKALKERHRQGKSLQACNEFGESIIHLCVRRGNPKMLKFLTRDAKVSIRVCCDFGRTPMHDVCWSLSNTASTTSEQRFAMMHMLLEACPLLLFIRDKRGHTPLSYVPKNKWAECNAFLSRFQAEGGLETDGQQ